MKVQFHLFVVVALISSACSSNPNSSGTENSNPTPAVDSIEASTPTPAPTGVAVSTPAPTPLPLPESNLPLKGKKVLVYYGVGSCKQKCAEAFFNLVKRLGGRPLYVNSELISAQSTREDIEILFDNTHLWIQPGGDATTAAKAMSTELKKALREYIYKGGLYYGAGAGAFLATQKIGSSKKNGLGIFPGKTKPRKTKKAAELFAINFDGVERQTYWEGGPVFESFPADEVTVIARYPDQKPAIVSSRYGSGRVILSALHLEALKEWLDFYGLRDPDGIEIEQFGNLVR